MKKLLLLLIVLLVSCRDHDTSRRIFRFSVGHVLDNEDVWFVLHDHESGELIDYRLVRSGTTEFFDSKKSNASGKMNVTVFRATKTGQKRILAEVYTGIDEGTAWIFANAQRNYDLPNSGGVSGTYALTVTGLPSIRSFDISDEFGACVTDPGSFSAGTFSIRPDVHGNSAGKQLLTIETGIGKRKYTWLEKVASTHDVSVSYDSFKEFDRYLTLTFPGTNNVRYNIIGYDASSAPNYSSFIAGHLNPSQLRNTLITQLDIGILDYFPLYTINIDMFPYRFQSVGPAPTSIDFVDPNDFKTSSPTISSYSITTSKTYSYRTAAYGYTHDDAFVNINYNAPAGDFKHFEAFPVELATKYGITMDDIKYVNTTFMVKGQSYEDLLKWTFSDFYPLTTPYQQTIVYSQPGQ